jgi:hypothetical protein
MTRHFRVLIPPTNTTVEIECRLLPTGGVSGAQVTSSLIHFRSITARVLMGSYSDRSIVDERYGFGKCVLDHQPRIGRQVCAVY